jgi:hypothetical protein
MVKIEYECGCRLEMYYEINYIPYSSSKHEGLELYTLKKEPCDAHDKILLNELLNKTEDSNSKRVEVVKKARFDQDPARTNQKE